MSKLPVKISQSKLFFKIFYSSILSWFAINASVFVTVKYLKIVFNADMMHIVSIKAVLVISILFSLFFIFYSHQMLKLISITKKTKNFPFGDSLVKFREHLTIFEKLMYLLFTLVILLIATTFNEIINIYIYGLFGKSVSIVFFLFLFVFTLYFIFKVFNSQKFLFFKMGI